MQKPNLLEDKPILNSDENTWGIKLNKIIDKLQSFVNSIVDNLNNKLDKGNVTNDYSSAEKIEAKIKEKVNATDYDNLKIKVDNQSLDYTTFKQEFKDGNYIKFNTTKNLEDKTGIVKDLVIENITLNNINGEPYTKASNISESDVKTIGDRLYEPKIEKKTGFNLDVSSLITSNSESVLASTKLVNQVISEVKQDMTTMSSRLTRDLQTKVSSTDFNSLKSKVDSIDTTTLSSQLNAKANKTDLNDVIKNLRLDNSKLKYKQFNGTIDEDKEIDLPSGSGSVTGNSEFDTFLNREWWKDNEEARGYGLLGFQYKELVNGFAGSRIDGVTKPFGILKYNNNIIGAVKLTKLDLGSIIVDSLSNSLNNSVYRVRFNAYNYGKQVLDNFDTNKSKLTPRPKKILDRLSGSVISEVSRTLTLNSERMKFIANEFSKGVLMDISVYQDIILTENPIHRVPINSNIGDRTLKYLAILLGVSRVDNIERNKVYVTQGNFELNSSENTSVYLKDLSQVGINPINPHINLTFEAVNEFNVGQNLPKYFYCLIYRTETDLVYLPLINHFCIKKTDDTIFYAYLTKLYNGSATWDYDPQRAIINITPKKLIQDTYKTFNVTDNRVAFSDNNYTNRYQIDMDNLVLTEDARLNQKTVDRYYNNKYYGYTYWDKQKEELYVIMNLNTFNCMNKLYFSTKEDENIGDEALQTQYREEYFKNKNSSSDGGIDTSSLYKVENADKDLSSTILDTWTNTLVTQKDIIGKEQFTNLDSMGYLPRYIQYPSINFIESGELDIQDFEIYYKELSNKITTFLNSLESNKLYCIDSYFTMWNREDYPSTFDTGIETGINLKVIPNFLANVYIRGWKDKTTFSKLHSFPSLLHKSNNKIYLYPLINGLAIQKSDSIYSIINTFMGDKDIKAIQITENIDYRSLSKNTKEVIKDVSADKIYTVDEKYSKFTPIEYYLVRIYKGTRIERIWVATHRDLKYVLTYRNIKGIVFYPLDNAFTNILYKESKSKTTYKYFDNGRIQVSYLEVPDVERSLQENKVLTKYIDMNGSYSDFNKCVTEWIKSTSNLARTSNIVYKSIGYDVATPSSINSVTNFGNIKLSYINNSLIFGTTDDTTKIQYLLNLIISFYFNIGTYPNEQYGQFKVKITKISSNQIKISQYIEDMGARKTYLMNEINVNTTSTQPIQQNIRGFKFEYVNGGLGTKFDVLNEYFNNMQLNTISGEVGRIFGNSKQKLTSDLFNSENTFKDISIRPENIGQHMCVKVTKLEGYNTIEDFTRGLTEVTRVD